MGTLVGWQVAPDFEYQITNSECVGVQRVFNPDGTLREVKATFANGAVLRLTMADPEGPLPGESTAGPFWA
jgi:hypothetical protein